MKISSLVADCNNLFDIVLHIVAQPVDEKLVEMTKITQLLLFLSKIKNTFSGIFLGVGILSSLM